MLDGHGLLSGGLSILTYVAFPERFVGVGVGKCALGYTWMDGYAWIEEVNGH